MFSEYLTKNPRTLFLIDGIGALLSAFLLAIVLADLQHIFGIRPTTLYTLAIIPCLFAVYDLNCLVRDRLNVAPFLKAIAIMNLIYCAISLIAAIYSFSDIKVLGWIYITSEIIVVSVLANTELKVARALASRTEKHSQATT